MAKSHIRSSKASGSTQRKVERAIALGWQPGTSPSELVRYGRAGRPWVDYERQTFSAVAGAVARSGGAW